MKKTKDFALKHKLLVEANFDIEKAEMGYNYLTENDSNAKNDRLPNGIYYLEENGIVIPLPLLKVYLSKTSLALGAKINPKKFYGVGATYNGRSFWIPSQKTDSLVSSLLKGEPEYGSYFLRGGVPIERAIWDFKGDENTARMSICRDFYIPSLGELLLVRKHLSEINEVFGIMDKPLITNELYWSSTCAETKKMWCVDFNEGCIVKKDIISDHAHILKLKYWRGLCH